jgi:hypothetical protein
MLQEAANGAKRDCSAILPLIAERRRRLQTEALALGRKLYEGVLPKSRGAGL